MRKTSIQIHRAPVVVDEAKYVHCRVNHRLEVVTADGSSKQVSAPIEIVWRRLCAVGRELRRSGDRVLVRFRDGDELWVAETDCSDYDNPVPA